MSKNNRDIAPGYNLKINENELVLKTRWSEYVFSMENFDDKYVTKEGFLSLVEDEKTTFSFNQKSLLANSEKLEIVITTVFRVFSLCFEKVRIEGDSQLSEYIQITQHLVIRIEKLEREKKMLKFVVEEPYQDIFYCTWYPTCSTMFGDVKMLQDSQNYLCNLAPSFSVSHIGGPCGYTNIKNLILTCKWCPKIKEIFPFIDHLQFLLEQRIKSEDDFRLQRHDKNKEQDMKDSRDRLSEFCSKPHPLKEQEQRELQKIQNSYSKFILQFYEKSVEHHALISRINRHLWEHNPRYEALTQNQIYALKSVGIEVDEGKVLDVLLYFPDVITKQYIPAYFEYLQNSTDIVRVGDGVYSCMYHRRRFIEFFPIWY